MYNAVPLPRNDRPLDAVLSVSPLEDDHTELERILCARGGSADEAPSWTVSRAASLSSALRALACGAYPVVICERDLPLGDWRDLLKHSSSLVNCPYTIVSSLHADDRLWAEALNLGAYDVLAKPFNAAEVIRVVTLASDR